MKANWTTRRFDSITTIANGMVSPTDPNYIDAVHIGPEISKVTLVELATRRRPVNLV